MPVETYVVSTAGKYSIDKDAQAVLDYKFDWSLWLAGLADTISAATAIAYPGDPSATNTIAVDSTTFSAGIVTVWVSGGLVGETVMLTCHITTVGGRQDERSVYLKLKER